MNRIVVILTLGITLMFAAENSAQTNYSSWSAGLIGLTYSRLQKSVVKPGNANFGYNIFLQRNFSSNTTLRLKGSYLSMQGGIPGNMFSYNDGNPVKANTENMRANLVALDLDFMYKFFPESFASPYLGAGIGGTLISPFYPADIANVPTNTKVASELNLFIGSEWNLIAPWKLITEIGYHASEGYPDGLNNSGITGTFPESYIAFSAGVEFYFGIPDNFGTEKSYSGLRRLTVRSINPNLKEFTWKPVEINNDKYAEVYPFSKNGLSSIVVYFKSNKSKVQPEFYSILNIVAEVLRTEPGINLEVQGYSDDIGSDTYNNLLSKRRAESVRKYLVEQGVAMNRLTIKGYGKTMPATTNKTDIGRAENRRVKFLIK